jgi:VanZ family protein
MVFLKNFQIVFVWSVFIMVLSLFPGKYLPVLPDIYHLLKPDKIVHLVLFGVFSFLLMQSILKQYGKGFLRFYGTIIALAIVVSFGLLTELLQHLLNINRSGNIYDVIANTIGCILGITVFWVYRRKKMTKANAN